MPSRMLSFISLRSRLFTLCFVLISICLRWLCFTLATCFSIHVGTRSFDVIMCKSNLQKNLWLYEIICDLIKEFPTLRKNSGPYERTRSLMREFVALRKFCGLMKELATLRENSHPYVIVCGITKEFAALRKNLLPYERICYLASIHDKVRTKSESVPN